jgi:ABC-type branched-subunit amino acid transport system substrate-binding protein
MIDSIIILGYGLVGVFTIEIAISVWQRWLNLRQNGVTVEGRITSHHIDSWSEDTFTIYYVTYSYEYDGKAYWDCQSVSGRRNKALVIGMNVPIRCLPNNPKVATLENNLTLSPIVGALILLGVGATFLVPAILSVIAITPLGGSIDDAVASVGIAGLVVGHLVGPVSLVGGMIVMIVMVVGMIPVDVILHCLQQPLPIGSPQSSRRLWSYIGSQPSPGRSPKRSLPRLGVPLPGIIVVLWRSFRPVVIPLPLIFNFLIIVIFGCMVGCFLGIAASFTIQNSPPMPTAAPTASLPDGIGVTQAADGEYIGISDGTFAFDTNRPDGNLKRQAADELKTNDVSGALSLWQSGLAADTNDAEALIYLEDQQVLVSGNPYITLVVGTMITGDNVGVGRDDLQGAYIAQKEFNDGHKLSNNVEVRLLIANSGNVSAYATAVAQQIVQAAQQDHTIVGVMGWPYSSRALNAIGVLARAHIPMVSQTASSDQLTGISSYFFRVAPSNKGQAIAGAQYAKRVLHARNVALFVDPADSYSSSLATDFSQRFVADGNHIVVTENYTVGAQGQGKLPTLLQDALSHNPDLIYFSGYSTDISVLLTNLPTTGPSASLQILGGDALYEVGGYSSSARANFTRLHFTAFAYPDEWDVAYLTAQKPTFFNEYISAYNPHGQQPAGKYGYTRPSSDVMLSYDATLALLTGTNIALSGGKSSITPTDLQHGLTQIMGPQALQGVSGPIEFGSNGDPINKPFVVLAVDTHGRIHEERLQGCLPQNCP